METTKEDIRKYNLDIWKKIIGHLKSLKKEIIYVILSMFAIAGLEIAVPFMLKQAIDRFIVQKSLEGFEIYLIKYFLIILAISLLVYFFILQAGKIEMWLSYILRKKAFNKLQELSLSYYDKKPKGKIIARVISDVRKLAPAVAWGLVDLIWGLSFMLGTIGIMLYINFRLAIIALSIVPVLVFISFKFQKQILKAFRIVRKLNSSVTGAFSEGISGAITSKTLGIEEKNTSEFKKLSDKMKNKSVHAYFVSSMYMPLVLFFGMIGTVLALNFGGQAVMNKVITYGTLVLFITYTQKLFQPIRELSRIFSELLSAQAAGERIIELLEEPIDVKDTEFVKKIYEQKHETVDSIKGEVIFDKLNFSYKKGEPVLSDFNLKVKAGETIAFVGETGSGKSTIVNLFCRFYEPTEGKILIDGKDYRKRSLKWLHSKLGYVLQNPQLKNTTIRENIRYGKIDTTDEEVIEAAKLVNAHQFIQKLDGGYDFNVGENGGMLSTGQKQLISFARAIISNPKFFVLDEATSSIDTETEVIIQKTINDLIENRTSFIIAHRLSTIKDVDRIIYLENGEIYEMGTHNQLLKKKGKYYKLYKKQFDL
ncbi:MAG: ABC transporter ATP-binding protein [Bacillota bacterium]